MVSIVLISFKHLPPVSLHPQNSPDDTEPTINEHFYIEKEFSPIWNFCIY